MRASVVCLAMFGVLAGGAAAQTPADQVFTGELTESVASAAFDLQLEAGQIVTLSTETNDGLDTILTLTGPDGQTLAENDDRASGGVLTSQIVFVPTVDGRYSVAVTGFGADTGHFSLILSFGLDAGLSDAAQILREETVSFDASRTEYSFDADLAEGDILVASTFALTEELDSTLTLLDAGGEVVAQNDDIGDGSFNSQIVYQASAAGRYQVVASTYSGTDVGDMAFSLALDPEAEVPFDFSSIEGDVIATHDGMIDDDQDTHEYTVRLAAGQTLLALGDTLTGDLDLVMRLNGADGYPVAMNDDRGDGSLNSGFAFTSPEAATYTLVVSRYRGGDSSGEYSVVLSSVDASVVDLLRDLLENPETLSGPELMIETPDFRIYYTLEGMDASSTDYAERVGEALQEVLDTQVSRIGWAEPVRDPDGRYRGYIAEADGSMGITKPVEVVFDNPNTPDVRESASTRALFIIDNDFEGMGKTAPVQSLMRATVTHEFNHVIQYGYDGEEGLDWLYEATASWTETTTVGADQDATDYTETDYETPQLCWTTTEGGHDYGQWTLLQSMADSYGESFIVRVWENSVEADGFDTLAQPLAAVGSTIPDTIERWRVQNFALAYDLAPLFPSPVHLEHTMTQPGRWTVKGGLEELGANYYALEMEGRYQASITGDDNLELIGLGQREGQIEVIRLGRDGIIDTGAYDYAALMVFNRAMPEAPGVCSGVGYQLNVAPATRRASSQVAYRFPDDHFLPPVTGE